MNVKEMLLYLENKVAPVKLSDEFCAKYKMYDNSGIIINCGGQVTGALFTLDLTEKAVDEAEKLGYNLIVTHHPAIYGGITRLDTNCDPQAKAITRCLKLGISVISMHLNFDAAPHGIDYYLMRGLGGDKAEIAAELERGGYGRVYE
ncbi:MAG: Nif3-like dinuclear metal center hexameric protein, partial [Clostridia bacterium]|nr:Nif3-like dinuclear metal center hexameric protein [Clostridia bacterium]